MKYPRLNLVVAVILSVCLPVSAGNACPSSQVSSVDVALCSNAVKVARSNDLLTNRAVGPDIFVEYDETALRSFTYYLLVGPCAELLTGYQGQMLGFSSGVVLAIHEEQLVSVNIAGKLALYRHLLRNHKPTEYKHENTLGKIVLESRQCQNGVAQRELSAKSGRKSTSLIERVTFADGTRSRPHTLAVVTGDISVLGFLPNPDTHGGMLTFGVLTKDDVELVRADYSPHHPALTCE